MQPDDKHDLTAAIDRAIAGLMKLKGEIVPSSLRSMELQAECALAYSGYARRINDILGDVLVTAAESAASLGNGHVSTSARRDLRSNELLDAILADADDWANEVLTEEAA